MHAPRLAVAFTVLLAACGEEPANEAPAFTITAPLADALVTEGHGVELVGVVDDADDVPETLKVTWTVDGEPLCADMIPRPDGVSDCTWVAVMGGGAIEAVVTDPEGLSGSASVSVTVQEQNDTPTCSFDEPADGSTVNDVDPVTFRGTIADADDTLEVVFSSSLDKELGAIQAPGSGTVELIAGPLSLGEHTITMAVTDPRGASCSAEIELEVEAVDGDTAPPPDTDTPDPDTDTPDPDADSGV